MMMQTTLWFTQGTAIRAVEWQDFIDNEVTPRFTQGFAIYDAQREWPGNDGKRVKANSKALVLMHGVEIADNTHIEELRDIYKKRFAQASVMRVDAPACVGY